jgi:hypothetical protein
MIDREVKTGNGSVEGYPTGLPQEHRVQREHAMFIGGFKRA